LSSSLEAFEAPASKTARVLQTEVKKLAAAGFSIEFGPEPKGEPPPSPYFKLDWLLGSLIARARRPVFLIIDEVQGIAKHKEGERIAGALRAALTRHEQAVRVLFTGSSETQLTKLFASARASLYQFASRVAYQPLDTDFVEHVALRFKAAWAQYWHESTALQQALLIAVSDAVQITTEAGLGRIGALLGTEPTSPSSVSRAAGALKHRGLIERSNISTKAIYALTDPVFELWIRQNGAALLKSHLPIAFKSKP
jgi:hypothetical protein